MSIAKQIVVRYRAEGHLRFVVPRELRHLKALQQLEEELRQTEGVYRVDLYPRQGKLSIRYSETVIDFKSMARALYKIVSRIEIPPEEPAGSTGKGLAQGEVRPGMADWLKSKSRKARETLAAMGILSNKGVAGRPLLTAEKEHLVLDFCTDLLVLYLIKMHWHMIMGHWIRRPGQYRGEWMATVYMIFLLVRSKKPK